MNSQIAWPLHAREIESSAVLQSRMELWLRLLDARIWRKNYTIMDSSLLPLSVVETDAGTLARAQAVLDDLGVEYRVHPFGFYIGNTQGEDMILHLARAVNSV